MKLKNKYLYDSQRNKLIRVLYDSGSVLYVYNNTNIIDKLKVFFGKGEVLGVI